MNRDLIKHCTRLLDIAQQNTKATDSMGLVYLIDTLIPLLAKIDPLDVAIDGAKVQEFIRIRVNITAHRGNHEPSVQNVNFMNDMLKTALKQPISPILCNFTFIKEPNMEEILERDLEEAEICLKNGQNKACVVLCGSILEATLYGVLRRGASWTMDPIRNKTAFNRKNKIATNVPDIKSNEYDESWDLKPLINFVCDNALLPEKWRGIMHTAIREPRNLIHPTAELRRDHTVSVQAANASLAELKHVLSELGKKSNLNSLPFP